MQKLTRLDTILPETSGLAWVDGRLWSFNDSKGDPALYCIDLNSGEVITKTIVRNATNVDWEDIAVDDHNIYIADTGNNFNERDTLRIYRIPRHRITPDALEVDVNGVISFSFDEMITQTRAGLSSHDCEALLVYRDSLYLFSKDWVHHVTSVYIIPAVPGYYKVRRRYTYDVKAEITGADLSSYSNTVSLIGYRNLTPVIITYGFTENPGKINCGGKARRYPLHLGRQVEGICFDPGGRLYVTAEKRICPPSLFMVR